MKILLLGADGQLGRHLRHTLPSVGSVRASSRSTGDAGLRCDLSDPAAVARLLRDERPDLVVNAAAYTAVDKAESDEAKATLINARLPGVIGETVAAWNGAVIHYSTDYVFDGAGTNAHVETDVTRPVGVYGRSKLGGEQALAATGVDHLILRTAWVYSLLRHNFLTTMLRLGGERDHLSVVDDQRGTPTSAGFLAEATARMADTWMADTTARSDPGGVFHLTARGHTTWHGFADALFDEALETGRLARRPDVQRIATADYPTAAKRPAWSVLDTHKVTAAFGILPPEWRDDLRRVMRGGYDASPAA